MNVSWVFDQLLITGINLNNRNIAIITDEGKALLKAISVQLPLSFHMTCAKHWLGRHPGKWDMNGKKESLFWQMVSRFSQSNFVIVNI